MRPRRRVTRELCNGSVIITNTLPNRDNISGHYRLSVVPGIYAKIVRLPYLSALAVERIARLGVDITEASARMAAEDLALLRLFDADDSETERRERARACKKSKRRRA